MPLPFIAWAAIAAVGAWGVKKGIDAAVDFSDAEDIDEDAKSIYASAERSLNDSRENTQNLLESLGRRKEGLYKNGIIPFVTTFSRIKNVDFREIDVRDDLSPDDFKSEILRGLARPRRCRWFAFASAGGSRRRRSHGRRG